MYLAILSALFGLGLPQLIGGNNQDEHEEGSGHSVQTPVSGNITHIQKEWSLIKQIGKKIKNSTSINCPPSWVWYGHHCYKVFGDMTVNHAGAQIKCQNEGANLLSIESHPENEFFFKILHNAVQDGTLQSDLDIWLGATRTKKQSPFTWLSKSKVFFTYWDEGHPRQNRNDLCLQAVRKDFDWSKFQHSYAWQANPCSRKNAYVCEMDEPAPINGGWSAWTPSHCSASCGDGTQVLTRNCSNPVPQYGGQYCTGNQTKYQECKIKECPIDGKWSEWELSPCNATCNHVREKYRGQGVQEMSRTCNNPEPLHKGKFCQGISKSIQKCSIHCPNDGGWSDWRPSHCSASCGDGTQVLSRNCTNPVPQYGGQYCTGNHTKYQDCKIKECPIDGKWSEWAFSPCNATCNHLREKYRGQGVQEMSRTCNNPEPLHNGKFCQGISKSTQQCFIKCPHDGGWSDWKATSKCSKKCGEGYKILTRTCTNPVPQHGGADCTGDSNQTQTCNNGECHMEMIIDAEKQMPEFLLSCKNTPWIIDCDDLKFSYIMMIDQSGRFIEESSTGTELVSAQVAVKKSIVTSNDWATMMKNPRYLFKLSYNQDSQAYFLTTGSGKYVAAQGKIQLLDKTSPSAMWKLWKIDGRFLSLESHGSNGNFLVVQDEKGTLGREREFLTGIKTQFVSGFSLDRSKQMIKPEGIEEKAYGDVLLHYFTPNGEDKTGYICDYDWDLPDAEAMCRYLGFQSGMPTYDGQYSSNKYPDYIISGVACEEGTESFMECPFKSEYSNRKYFAQAAMLQFDGKGYGCNRGSKTDIAGVICGDQHAIESILAKDITCEKTDNTTEISTKAYKFQKHFRMVTNIISENRHWSDFMMPLPMSISLTTTLLLFSSQFDNDITLTTPTAPNAFWKHLWGDSLQSNLLYLANFISDTIEKSTQKMYIITYNSMNIQKYMEKVMVNAFSDDDYEYKNLLKRQLKYISRLVDDSVEKSMEIYTSFEETELVIKDLLFSLKMDRGNRDILKEGTKYLNMLHLQWATLKTFFQKFEGLLKIKQINFYSMDEIYNDIYKLKGSKPRKRFIESLQETNIHTMSYTLFAERAARFYRKFSEDVLTQTNLNLFYLNMQKIDDETTLARYKAGIIDEAKLIETKMSIEAGKEDSLMHDKIGSKLYSITNKLQCLFDKKLENGIL